MINAAEIGNIIQNCRTNAGMTQLELAERIHKSLRTVQKYEAADINMSVSTLNEIAAVLETTPEKLLGCSSYGDIEISSVETLFDYISNINADFEAGLTLAEMWSDKGIMNDCTAARMFSCLIIMMKLQLSKLSHDLSFIMNKSGISKKLLEECEANAFKEKNSDVIKELIGEIFLQAIRGVDGGKNEEAIKADRKLIKNISYDNIYENLNFINISVQNCMDVISGCLNRDNDDEAAMFLGNVLRHIDSKIVMIDKNLRELYGMEYGENPPKIYGK